MRDAPRRLVVVALAAAAAAGPVLRAADERTADVAEAASQGAEQGSRTGGGDRATAASDPATGAAELDALVIGGGGEPDGSELELERDAASWMQALAGTRTRLLFGGGAGSRSVREAVTVPPRPAPFDALSALFLPRPWGSRFRTPRLPVDGPATYGWVDGTLGAALAEGTRPLLVVVLTHGGPADDPLDVHALLWGNDPWTVRDALDLVSSEASPRPSRWVVGACHGGAFAALAEPEGRGPVRRCGFHATSWDRLASGCAAELEDGSRGYAARFAEALAAGRDLDADGVVTLEDGHLAAARQRAPFDVPLRSSDHALEVLAAALGVEADGEALAPIADLRLVLSAADRARPPDAARLEADEAREALEHALEALADAEVVRDGAFHTQRVAVLGRYPFAEDAYDPRYADSVRAAGAGLRAALHATPEAVALQEAEAEVERAAARADEARLAEARAAFVAAVLTRAQLETALARTQPAAFARVEALRRCERSPAPGR